MNLSKVHDIYYEQCYYCIYEKNSHSFYLNDCFIDNLTYKTNIKDAKLYYKPHTIIYHIKTEFKKFETIYKNKKWKWIIDFKDTEFNHYTAFTTVIELSNWIKNSNDAIDLKVITIKNFGYLIYPLIILAKLYLPKHIKITY